MDLVSKKAAEDIAMVDPLSLQKIDDEVGEESPEVRFLTYETLGQALDVLHKFGEPVLHPQEDVALVTIALIVVSSSAHFQIEEDHT